MKIISDFKRIKKFKNPVVALGVFDGVHRAHRQILRAAVKLSRKIKGTAVAVTFWPHPQKEESLYSLTHRLKLIADTGMDVCIVLRFTRAFAQASSEDFVKNILVNRIRAKYLYIGKNFRFGKGAMGTPEILKRLSRQYNFKVKVFPVIKIRAQAISSTAIRRLINQGDLAMAQYLLARPVSVLGTVIKGEALGRKLGFPTANIDPHHEIVPPPGIYAAEIMLGATKFKGVCYIGSKPTIKSKKVKVKRRKYIEVYIFNFNKNIYKRDLEIQFIKKIRKDRKFPSLKALSLQVQRDIKSAKTLLSLH